MDELGLVLPKSVNIQNPRLLRLYYALLFLALSGLSVKFLYLQEYAKVEELRSISASVWVVPSTVEALLSTAAPHAQLPQCSKSGGFRSPSSSGSSTNHGCATFCSIQADYPCTSEFNLYTQESEAQILLHTRVLELQGSFPFNSSTLSRSEYYVNTVHGMTLGIAYGLRGPQNQLGSSTTNIQTEIRKNRKVIRTVKGGQAIIMGLGELLELSGHSEVLDKPTFGLPDVVGRVSGVELKVEVSCMRVTFDTPVCTMDVLLAPQLWVFNSRVDALDGGDVRRQIIHGVRVNVHAQGSIHRLDFVSFYNALVATLVLVRLPKMLVYFVTIRCLGHMSRIYRKVVCELFDLSEQIGGMATRLMGSSVLFLELQDDSGHISKHRMSERMHEVFAEIRDRLGDEEVEDLTDFCFASVIRDSSDKRDFLDALKSVRVAHGRIKGSSVNLELPASKGKMTKTHFSAACSNVEHIAFGDIVELFDQNRHRSRMEKLFMPKDLREYVVERQMAIEASAANQGFPLASTSKYDPQAMEASAASQGFPQANASKYDRHAKAGMGMQHPQLHHWKTLPVASTFESESLEDKKRKMETAQSETHVLFERYTSYEEHLEEQRQCLERLKKDLEEGALQLAERITSAENQITTVLEKHSELADLNAGLAELSSRLEKLEGLVEQTRAEQQQEKDRMRANSCDSSQMGDQGPQTPQGNSRAYGRPHSARGQQDSRHHAPSASNRPEDPRAQNYDRELTADTTASDLLRDFEQTRGATPRASPRITDLRLRAAFEDAFRNYFMDRVEREHTYDTNSSDMGPRSEHMRRHHSEDERGSTSSRGRHAHRNMDDERKLFEHLMMHVPGFNSGMGSMASLSGPTGSIAGSRSASQTLHHSAHRPNNTHTGHNQQHHPPHQAEEYGTSGKTVPNQPANPRSRSPPSVDALPNGQKNNDSATAENRDTADPGARKAKVNSVSREKSRIARNENPPQWMSGRAMNRAGSANSRGLGGSGGLHGEEGKGKELLRGSCLAGHLPQFACLSRELLHDDSVHLRPADHQDLSVSKRQCFSRPQRDVTLASGETVSISI